VSLPLHGTISSPNNPPPTLKLHLLSHLQLGVKKGDGGWFSRLRGSVDHEVWTMRWGIKDNPHSNFSPTSTSLPKSPHPLSSKQKLHEDLFLHQPLCPATPNFNNFNQSPLYFTPPTRSSPQSVIVIAPSFSQCYRIASNYRRDLRGSSIFPPTRQGLLQIC